MPFHIPFHLTWVDLTSFHFNIQVLLSVTLAPVCGRSWRHPAHGATLHMAPPCAWHHPAHGTTLHMVPPCTWHHQRMEIQLVKTFTLFFNAHVRKYAKWLIYNYKMIFLWHYIVVREFSVHDVIASRKYHNTNIFWKNLIKRQNWPSRKQSTGIIRLDLHSYF